MHDRNLIWKTAKGVEIKIIDMESSHLENVLKHIDKNHSAYISLFSKNKIDHVKMTIMQKIRLRKLNRLSNDDTELF